MLAELCLEPECRRGHGGRLRRAEQRGGPCDPAAAGAVVAAAAGPGRTAGSGWPRREQLAAAGRGDQPGAAVLPLLRAREGERAADPGLAVLLVAALEPGRTSWTLPLDAVRLGPEDDATEVTAAQLRDVVARIIAAGHWKRGRPGHPRRPRLRLRPDEAGLAAGRPAGGGQRDGCALTGSCTSRPRRASRARTAGRPGTGAALRLGEPATWPDPAVTTRTETSPVRHRDGNGLGAGCTSSSPAAPAGKITRASCPSSRAPSSGSRSITCPASATRTRSGCGPPAPAPRAEEVDRAWQAFLRRFDIEHTFRFLKQQLGWTRPKLRDPAAADRWTWLVIAAYAQLHLARDSPPTSGCPGSGPAQPGRLTPPGSAAGFAASARTCPFPPARRNPPAPAPDAPPDRRTTGPPPATTSAKPSSEPTPRPKTA